MKVVVVAAVSANGVIGRTHKPCGGYPDLSPVLESRMCHGGKIHRQGPPGTYGLSVDDCLMCQGTGFVSCKDPLWSYPEHDAYVESLIQNQVVITDSYTLDRHKLPESHNVLVSPQILKIGLHPRAQSGAPNLKMALACPTVIDRDVVFVLGVTDLLTQSFRVADELHLTFISKNYDGNVLFPTEAKYVNGESYLFGEGVPRIVWNPGPIREDRITDEELDRWMSKNPPAVFERTATRQGQDKDSTFTTWTRVTRKGD